MKQISVKAKIAAWLTLLMALLAVLLVIFMLSVSSQVAVQTASDQLTYKIGRAHV